MKMDLLGIQKNTKGITRIGKINRLSVISLLFSLVLILGVFLIQGTQLSRKAPTYAAIQKVVLRDNEASSDFGSDNEASSDFGSGNEVSSDFGSGNEASSDFGFLGVPWCMFLTMTAIAYCGN